MSKYDDMLAAVNDLQAIYDETAKRHEAKLEELKQLIDQKRREAVDEAEGLNGEHTV